MINYIIQIVFFQVVFLAVYDLFLRKETFFKWNRLYLLITPILSFIIPLLKFESLQQTIPQHYIVLLPEVVLNPQVVIEQTANIVQTFNYLNMLFYIGIGFLSAVFILKLLKIMRLIISNNVIKKENYKLVLLENKQSAFSFFNYIFIDKSFIEKEELKVIEHELVHCTNYHTVDLLFFELLKIIMWFNPLIYIFQNRITLLHEYISDAEVVKDTDKKSYFNKLLAGTFEIENISFVNQFYKHSLIKKRIIMIAKEKSQSVKQLKYLLLIPVLASMLFYISCIDDISQTELESSVSQKELLTIYHNNKDGGLRTVQSEKETYFDIFTIFGEQSPNLNMKSLDYNALTDSEKEEFDNNQEKFSKMTSGELIMTIHELDNGRKIILQRLKIKEKSKSDYDNSEDVPFAVIDKVPAFPGCSGDKKALKDCLNKSIKKHVAQNFNSKVVENSGLSGKQKIYIKFKITKTGTIEIEGARAPNLQLEEEARRVVSSLPKMIPGKHKGKAVNVTYMLPIVFDVKE